MADWQPIETAPKDGTEVLVYARHENGSADFSVASFGSSFRKSYWTVANYCCGDGMPSGTEPTHWQPLPEPPHA